ncbi:molybdopterin-guanine dinucleotide biosynthesis protein B [candidate division KSB1 bacterium]|nr:molybdopterin-guanine dinucleotide biosynthesis protein B [candidate division KSB1 bacterium]
MISFQVCGHSNSGKTTLVTRLIRRLRSTNTRVASIKSIHFEKFTIDQPGTDTYLHKHSGADPVIACGLKETDFLYSERMEFMDIARMISADWLIVEGFNSFSLPKIVCAADEEGLNRFVDRRTFAISGVISQHLNDFHGIPVFNSLDSEAIDQLLELIKEKTFPLLPYVDDDCCGLCGLTCATMVEAIVQGEKRYEDCIISQSRTVLKINGQEIPIVPFVQSILRNAVTGVVRELDGWREGVTIDVTIKP